MKRKSAMQEAAASGGRGVGLRQPILTVGSRFRTGFKEFDGLMDVLGSQRNVIEEYTEFYWDWLVDNRKLDIRDVEVTRQVARLSVVVETEEHTLRRLAFDSLTRGAAAMWLDFVKETGVETSRERPQRVENFFVTTNPEVDAGKQLVLAQGRRMM